MKFNTSEMPANTIREGVSVGDVYKANGGRGTTAFWIVIAIVGRSSHCIGIDKEGETVSTTSYGTHVFESRELIGRCDSVEDLNLPIEWLNS